MSELAERSAEFANRLDRLVTSFHPSDADEAVLVIESLIAYACLLARSAGETDEGIRAFFETALTATPKNIQELKRASGN